jgi:t-SNARE complex subunit (syntaxin)
MGNRSLLKFLQEIEATSRAIKELPAEIEKLSHSQRQFLGAVREEDKRRLRKEIRDSTSQFTQETLGIKGSLKEVKKRNDRYKERHGENKTHEARESHLQSLTTRLAKHIESFSRMQIEFSHSEKERLKSQYVIAKPTATKDELKRLDTDGDGKAAIHSAFTIGSKSAKKALEDARKRHDSIQEIDRSIREVTGLVKELNTMIHTSGRNVDKIGVSAKSTKKKTEKAHEDLDRALVYQRRATYFKRLAIAGLILLFILVIIALLVVIVFTLLQYFKPASGSGSSSGGQTGASSTNATAQLH